MRRKAIQQSRNMTFRFCLRICRIRQLQRKDETEKCLLVTSNSQSIDRPCDVEQRLSHDDAFERARASSEDGVVEWQHEVRLLSVASWSLWKREGGRGVRWTQNQHVHLRVGHFAVANHLRTDALVFQVVI